MWTSRLDWDAMGTTRPGPPRDTVFPGVGVTMSTRLALQAELTGPGSAGPTRCPDD
jgi:hypothetical protein